MGKKEKSEEELEPVALHGLGFSVQCLVWSYEAVHIVYIRSFSSEIFAAISMVVGTILGAFFGQKAWAGVNIFGYKYSWNIET